MSVLTGVLVTRSDESMFMLTFAHPHPVNPRVDVVYEGSGRIEVVTGTPAVAPVTPVVPQHARVIATVIIPATLDTPSP